MSTTGAQDVAAALVSILETYKAAHPTHLHRSYASRPGTFTDQPIAYVDVGPELIVHDAGTRSRTFAPTVTWVGTFSETHMALRNLVRDGLVDAFTAGVTVSLSSGFLIINTAVEPTEEREENTVTGNVLVYPALVFRFDQITLQEGRV